MAIKLDIKDFAVIMNPDAVEDDEGFDTDDCEFEVEFEDDFDIDEYNAKFGDSDRDDSDDEGDSDSDDEGDSDSDDEGDDSDDEGDDSDDEGDGPTSESGGAGVGAEGSPVAPEEGGDDAPEADFDGDVETHSNEDGADIEPEDVFGDMKFEIPKFDASVANTIADKIRDEAIMKRADLGGKRDPSTPYTPHPDAGAEAVTYDETDFYAKQNYETAKGLVATTSRAIAAQMRRVLSARSQVRTQRDQRRGRLDRNKLHTLNLPGRIRPNRNVFTTTIEGQTQRVAVAVLVDQSGSMGGTKIECAKRAAVALGDALNSLGGLGVKFGVYGFDSHWDRQARDYAREYDRLDTLRIHNFKSFGENWNIVAPRIGAMVALHCNPDNEAIRYVAGELLQVENVDRRVLLVLSDGEPATVTGRDDGDVRLHADTKLAVRQCGELGIETLGIGICSDAVKRFYPSWVVINKVDELERVLMDGLKSAFGITKRVAA